MGKAAYNGYMRIKLRLGQQSDISDIASLPEAKEWFQMAAAQGHLESIEALKKLLH
jgi:TPR repeat protein